jgi:hypothetical protein
VDLVTLLPANAASPMDFDAWGKRREAERWSEAVPWTANLESQLRTSTTHGYTGHEMAEAGGGAGMLLEVRRHVGNVMVDEYDARLPGMRWPKP